MTKSIIGKYYKTLPLAQQEIKRQNKDKFLKIRQSVILKFNNGYLVVAKKVAENCGVI